MSQATRVAAWVLAGTVGVSAQPDGLVVIGSLDGPAELVVAVGTRAYVTGGATLRVVDLSDPAHPIERATFEAPDRIYGLHASGPFVYLAVGLEGLLVVDVTSSETPRVVASHATPGQAVDVTTVGASVLVVNLMTGLEVVDLSSASAPAVLVTQDTPGYQRAVSAHASRAFVVDQPTGVVLFDLSTPEAPRELGTHPSTTAPARSVAVDSGQPDRVYVVYERTGVIEAVDVTDPAHPTVLGTFTAEGGTPGVVAHDATLFVPMADDGLAVVDMTDPATPRVTAMVDTPGTARMVAVTEDGAVVLADDSSLLLLDQR